MANLVEVIVGTYEEFLLGYKMENLRNENRIKLNQSFATRSHTGSIRCVSVNGTYLASGGADDRVFIYDMKERKEVQILMEHDGTINALAFTPDGSHILTGGDDGKMIAMRSGTWKSEAVWKRAHAGSPVTHISCHPSGKLALTLGGDLTLRTWNLVKGRLAYTTNLKSKQSLGHNPDCLSWSPDGEHFTITGMRTVEIWNVNKAGVVKEQSCESKPISLCWLTKTRIAVGLEDGRLMIMDINSKSEPKLWKTHKNRVKGVAYVNNILATASSSGEISLWIVNFKENSIAKITSTNIGCRPTCIALLDLKQFGDDYVLKQETEDCEEDNTVQEKKPRKQGKSSVGSVVVEVDEEEEDEAEEDEQEEIVQKKKKKKIEVEETNGSTKKQKNKKRKSVMEFEEESILEDDSVIEKAKVKKKKYSLNINDENGSSETPCKSKKKKSKLKRMSI